MDLLIEDIKSRGLNEIYLEVRSSNKKAILSSTFDNMPPASPASINPTIIGSNIFGKFRKAIERSIQPSFVRLDRAIDLQLGDRATGTINEGLSDDLKKMMNTGDAKPKLIELSYVRWGIRLPE